MGTLILALMQRRNFLLALGWMAAMGWCWGQSRPEQMASLLLGEPVAQLPPEVLPDLHMLLTRADSLEQLRDWPAGEAAARRVLLRLLEKRGWEWVPFANAPARPPAQRGDWGHPWTSK
ncbi:MAG: hypothetical protein KF760_13885 [Candidatus Eremiobacteraeota bacterium]|nr:hypothetical protein [Candidatus Eremiobacteraeota bacterium]